MSDQFMPVGRQPRPVPLPPVRRSLSAEDLVTLNEEIAAMARAGLPLDQGLGVLAREMGHGRLQKVTQSIADDLRQGKTLPEALQSQHGQVPPFYAALVTAGVRSGRVSDVLATLTQYARTMSDLRSTVLNALLYPLVIIVLAIGLFSMVSIVLVPQFERIFDSFRMQLPFMTQFILAIVRHPVQYCVVPLALLLGGFLTLRYFVFGGEKGRHAWTRWVYTIPIVGSMIRSSRLASFADLLAILVDHAVPLPEAVRLAGEASSDPLIMSGVGQIEEQLSQGAPLGLVLRRLHIVPELIAWMAGMGERRGQLGEDLRQVAAMYRRNVETRAHLLRWLLPSLLIVGTALMVFAIFIFVIFVPMLALMRGLSGG